MTNAADEEARGTWLAERPEPDHDYYDAEPDQRRRGPGRT